MLGVICNAIVIGAVVYFVWSIRDDLWEIIMNMDLGEEEDDD